MPEDTLTAPEVDSGLSTENVESHDSSLNPQGEVENPETMQTSEPQKAAPVGPPASQPSSNGTPKRMLPSSFYNQRKENKIQTQIDEIRQMVASLQKQPSAPVAQPHSATDAETYWTDPKSGLQYKVEPALKSYLDSFKQEFIQSREKETQESAFNRGLQEADKLVSTNERSRTNPNFGEDIRTIIGKYKSLQALSVVDPMAAVQEAIDLYDQLVNGQMPKGPMPPKGQMGSTQTGVNAGGVSGEDALIAEMESLQGQLNPITANDPKVGGRIKEIANLLEKLNA